MSQGVPVTANPNREAAMCASGEHDWLASGDARDGGPVFCRRCQTPRPRAALPSPEAAGGETAALARVEAMVRTGGGYAACPGDFCPHAECEVARDVLAALAAADPDITGEVGRG